VSPGHYRPVIRARNADRCTSHGRSVCPSVRPSRSGVSSKRIKIRKSGLLATNRFSPEKCQSTPTKHDGSAVLFAVAELLVVRADLTVNYTAPLKSDGVGYGVSIICVVGCCVQTPLLPQQCPIEHVIVHIRWTAHRSYADMGGYAPSIGLRTVPHAFVFIHYMYSQILMNQH